ncbi:MAG: TolC family protein [Myxococcota bacterium]
MAVVTDGPSDLFRNATTALANEARALAGEALTFPDAPTHEADFTIEGVTTTLQAALDDDEVDMIVGFGFLTGTAVAAIEELDKPVFLPFATPRFQNLPSDGATSGRRNLTYLAGLVNLDREMRRFREVMRREQAVMVIDRYLADAIPNLEDAVRALAGEDVTVTPVDDTAAAILNAIPASAQAVYLGPLVRLPDSERRPLLDGLIARNLPSYASEGRTWVEDGAFVSTAGRDDKQRRFRRIALNLVEATQGERLERFSTTFEAREELVINMATARRIGCWPRFELMTEAELLGQDELRARGRELSLRTAVDEAIAANLSYAASQRDVEIARQQLQETRGRWLPSVDAQADFAWIDPDVASSLQSAERQLSWGVSATQVVYSPTLHQGIRAQRANVESVRQSVEALELDLVQDAATAYVNVLRARTAEAVNQENLSRIRQNLGLAEVRVQVGTAGREEVFRWQVEIADSRADVIAASALRNQAQIALNRLLNRESLEEPFTVAEPMNADEGVVLDERVVRYADDPWSFGVLRDFVAAEAIQNSPELRQLDAAIEAQRHQVRGLRHALFVPDVFVSGGFTHTFRRAGEGGQDSPPLVGVDLPPRDDFTWQVGAGLRFSIGVDRFPAIEQVDVAIDQLQTQRQALAQSIDQGVRSAMHQAGSSRAAVRLRRDAATAAGENLDLVRDAYRRGTVTIITLIDAQNQALLSNLSANNAVYDFMIDFLSVERASAAFGFRMSEDERNDFVTRLERFAAERAAEGENP